MEKNNFYDFEYDVFMFFCIDLNLDKKRSSMRANKFVALFIKMVFHKLKF